MLALTAALLVAPPLIIRRAQVDISPPEPLPLGGYTERKGKHMEPGGDPLYARCIELERGNLKIAIVVAEMLTIPESLCREVKARLPKDIHLFLQATHTHSAPDSQMLNDRMTFSVPGIATYRRKWLDWYADKIASSVTSALAASQTEETSDLSAFAANVDANRPRRKGGKPERMALFLKGIAPVFAYYTAHPTVFDSEQNKTSGDWIGIAAQRFGTPILNGAIGDVSPAADGPTPAAKMEDFFKRFAVGIGTKRPTWKTVWDARKPVKWFDVKIDLDSKHPSPAFLKDYGMPAPLAKSLVDKFAPPEANIAALRLGDLAIVGVPGEPTSILGNQIRDAGLKMRFKYVLVCSHVNGWIGYILDPADYDRGGYEATLSFYGRYEGPKVVSAAIDALRRLR